jgi:predicted nuclease of predicted toxin-antitoxin system
MLEASLRLYLDQMLNIVVADALRNEGYDVLRTSDVGQARADDYEILQKAIKEKRILITLDEHFGDWTVLPLSRHPGVIRVKADHTTSDNIIKLLIPFFRSNRLESFENTLVILSKKRSKWIRTI